MINSQNVTIKIVAPDAHQLMRSLRAFESLTPVYFEGAVKQNDKDSGLHVFLTLPLNWFTQYENSQVLLENEKYAYAEPNSQVKPCTAETNPVNRLTEVS